jgi:hypothetical protein
MKPKKMNNVCERGLKRDRKDDSRMRDGRAYEMIKDRKLWLGHTYEKEWFQPMPFFWTREGNTANALLGHYKGATAFLIAGGPSFKLLDLTKLKNCWTLGLNNSPRTYRPDAWISVDDPSRFIRSIWVDPKIMKFVPIGAVDKPLWDNYNDCPLDCNVGDVPNVYYFKRNSKFHANRWLWEDTLNWGNAEDYGGGRSVILPAIRILFLLGFRTIFLLGVDLNMSETNTYHFDEGRDKGAVNCNLNTYKRMREEYFPQLKPHFDAVGLKIYNCNEKSELKVFDHVPFEEAVAYATDGLGDIANEPTRGLYCKPESKFEEWEKRQKVGQKTDTKPNE